MPAPRHLEKAPLIEALLDIRVVPRADSKFEDLTPLHAAYKDRYGNVATKRNAGFQVDIDPMQVQRETTAKTTSVPVGFMFSNASSGNRVQAALDEFTQNILGPYADFESLVAEAKPNWEIFKKVSRPLSISRIALRYVNDLRLPRDMARFEDFVPVMPPIPQALPQALSDFVIRMTIENPEIGVKAIINQIFQGTIDERGVQVILDIDAIQEGQLEIDSPSLWERFEALRKFKNDIFFNFVTERLLEKYA